MLGTASRPCQYRDEMLKIQRAGFAHWGRVEKCRRAQGAVPKAQGAPAAMGARCGPAPYEPYYPDWGLQYIRKNTAIAVFHTPKTQTPRRHSCPRTDFDQRLKWWNCSASGERATRPSAVSRFNPQRKLG